MCFHKMVKLFLFYVLSYGSRVMGFNILVEYRMHRTIIQYSSNMGRYQRRQLDPMSQGLQAQQVVQSQLPHLMFQMQCTQLVRGGGGSFNIASMHMDPILVVHLYLSRFHKLILFV